MVFSEWYLPLVLRRNWRRLRAESDRQWGTPTSSTCLNLHPVDGTWMELDLSLNLKWMFPTWSSPDIHSCGDQGSQSNRGELGFKLQENHSSQKHDSETPCPKSRSINRTKFGFPSWNPESSLNEMRWGLVKTLHCQKEKEGKLETRGKSSFYRLKWRRLNMQRIWIESLHKKVLKHEKML